MQPATVNGIITRESLPPTLPPANGRGNTSPSDSSARHPEPTQPPAERRRRIPMSTAISLALARNFPHRPSGLSPATPLPKPPATPPLSATLAGMALDSARLLISGASGLLGSVLVPTLQARGFTVTRLVRRTPAADDQIHWIPSRSIDPESVSGFDAVIHLAGESVATRWSEARKAKIRESRVTSTRLLAQALARASKPPAVLITASAIGFYGNRADEILNE